MSDEMDHVEYALKHYVCTSTGLKWVPCGPDCKHQPQPDVTAELVSFTPAQIEWRK